MMDIEYGSIEKQIEVPIAFLTDTEEGKRELGWKTAVLEDYYNGHGTVSTRLLADLPVCVPNLAAEAARR